MKNVWYIIFFGSCLIASLSAMQEGQTTPRKATLVDIVVRAQKAKLPASTGAFSGNAIFIDKRFANALIDLYSALRLQEPSIQAVFLQGYLRENRDFNTGGKCIVQFDGLPAGFSLSELCTLRGMTVKERTFSWSEPLAELSVAVWDLQKSRKKGGK